MSSLKNEIRRKSIAERMAETEYHYVAARNASGEKTNVHEHDDNNLPGPTTKRRARVKYEILNGRTGTSGRCPSLQHVAVLEMVDGATAVRAARVFSNGRMQTTRWPGLIPSVHRRR